MKAPRTLEEWLAGRPKEAKELTMEAQEKVRSLAERFTSFAIEGETMLLVVPGGRILIEAKRRGGNPILVFDMLPFRSGDDHAMFWQRRDPADHLVDRIRAQADRRRNFEELMELAAF
jgi:hypothetical protein